MHEDEFSVNRMADRQDSELVADAQKGSERATGAIMIRYLDLIQKKTANLTVNGLAREDIVQECLIGLLLAVRTYDQAKGSSFRTYAGICIDNCIRKALSKAGTGKAKAFHSAVAIDKAADAFFEGKSPEQILVDKEQAEDLSRQIKESLSVLENDVLLKYLQGFSYVKIAGSLGISQKTVDNAMTRIRQKLKSRFVAQ